MSQLPKNDTSYWFDSADSPGYPRLSKDLRVDTVVIGAGIAGLSAAYFLKQAGQTVAVLEKDTIGKGVTGNTTGKVTSQHNIIYHELREQLGEKAARIYGEANQAAIQQIEAIIHKERIDCDWQRDDNYVYTTASGQVDRLKEEARTARALGLPATFETSAPLPFEIEGAVRFSNQAKFNAQKYILGLAHAIHGSGSFVFENTRANATGVHDGTPCKVKTNSGTVTANSVIIATNVPFTAGSRGSYCVKEYPQKSYIVAGRPNRKYTGMYISPDDGHYSILPFTGKDGELLLIGGEGHIPGTRLNTEVRYQRLAEYAKKHFGIETIEYRWSARDYLSYDSLPLVGKLYPWSNHVYVTTAFMKWGLTNSAVSATLLRDMILGKDNAWAATFDSSRLKPVTSIPKVAAEYAGLR